MKGDPVRYISGQMMRVGDEVVADKMPGTIVCDFDNRVFAEGYADWDLPEVEMLGGGTLSSGIMILTLEAGLIHYPDGTGNIAPARVGGGT